jgi:hypothetical protein
MKIAMKPFSARNSRYGERDSFIVNLIVGGKGIVRQNKIGFLCVLCVFA